MPSFEFDFEWEQYGRYIDEGVRGAGGVRKTTVNLKRQTIRVNFGR